ncbi:VOC family protein [Oceanicoccus sp. KOV_DT_Chl]|uniref:VOC family protein n=1 Tax=Oceanicoccus sp. KOV_DT_Chl TaxID=1904639 RepID=UPI000C7E2EA9|nr:VOC family protein [Oceanicoccus sp. KOV_DT_Chl]
MALQRIHHFAINAPADVLAEVLSFYDQLLDLKPGFRPDFGFTGYWLYAGDHPILHLLEDNNRAVTGTGFFDHIAFACDDLAATIAKLDAMEVHYDRLDMTQIGQSQLFVRDPAGTAVELNFTVK